MKFRSSGQETLGPRKDQNRVDLVPVTLSESNVGGSLGFLVSLANVEYVDVAAIGHIGSVDVLAIIVHGQGGY